MKKNYIIVTSRWLKKAIPNSYQIEEAKYVVKNNKRYYTNNINKITYTKNKIKVAMWLEEIFGGILKYLPDIKEEKIKCADYYFKNKHWKLIEIKDINELWSLVKKKEEAHNFIVDISKTKITKDDIYYQLNKIFGSKYADWIEIIIVKKNYQLIDVFKNKYHKQV